MRDEQGWAFRDLGGTGPCLSGRPRAAMLESSDIGTQKECLELIGCYGPGRVEKFAEILAATSLAGEITVCANVANGKFVKANKTYGRKYIGKKV